MKSGYEMITVNEYATNLKKDASNLAEGMITVDEYAKSVVSEYVELQTNSFMTAKDYANAILNEVKYLNPYKDVEIEIEKTEAYQKAEKHAEIVEKMLA